MTETTPNPYENRRVLIIDDDRDFAESLFDILELHEYDSRVLNDISLLNTTIEDFKPHVCLIDIRLGNENGIDLIPRIIALSSKTLCVMITAYAHIETAVNALQNGAYDYMRKPISGEELVSTLNRCFEKLKLEFDKKKTEDILKVRNRELEEANDRLRCIVDSNKKIAACSDLREFGTRSLEEFANNLSANGGSFFIRKENSFVLLHSLDSEHTPQELPIPLKDGSIFGHIVENKSPVMINNINSIPDVKKSGWQGYKDTSLISFPILDTKGDVVGLISLHDKLQPPFTKQDLDYGLLISSHTSESLTALQATEKVIKGEEKYRRLVETMTDGLIVLNDEFFITYANDRFSHIIGYSREELLSQPITNFMDDVTRIDFCKLFKESDYDSVTSYEVIWVQKDGSKRTSLVSPQSFPILNAKNDDTYCFAVVTDITDRKSSEEALQQQKYQSDIRVKELDCLFAISSLVDKSNFLLEDVLSKAVTLIPQAFQHPEVACTSIKLYDQHYCTKSCKDSENCLKQRAKIPQEYIITHPLSIYGTEIGSISVWYREEVPASEEGPFLKEELRLIHATAELLGSIIKRKKSQEDLQSSVETLQTAMEGIIQAMAMTTEMRDPYTAGHQRRVSKLASAIAEEMGLPEDDVDGIRLAGIIHDLGKIYVPAEILSKPGHISDIELSIIRTHPQVGHDILKTIAFPWPIASMVQQHHERLNGSGYPLGLDGDDILLGARILAVADTVEAMASHRPYRPSLGIDAALDEINKNQGKFYEPKVVEICTDLFKNKNFEF